MAFSIAISLLWCLGGLDASRDLRACLKIYHG